MVSGADVASATRAGDATEVDPRWPLTKRIRRGWVIEILVGVAVYLLYDWLRDQVVGSGAAAFTHAQQVVDVERYFGIYQEHALQQLFVSADWFMAFWNIWYGTIHFVMPVVALVCSTARCRRATFAGATRSCACSASRWWGSGCTR